MSITNSNGQQKRAKEFALLTIRVYRLLPKTGEGEVVAKQLLRAATSVGANTRAAFRARSTKEFIAKSGRVIEEADECEFWCEILEEAKILGNKLVNELRNEAASILWIFVSLINKAR